MHTPEVPAAAPRSTEQLAIPASAPMPSQAPVQPPQGVTMAPDAPAFCHAKDLAVYLYPECNGGLKTPGSPVSAEPLATRASTRKQPTERAVPPAVRTRTNAERTATPVRRAAPSSTDGAPSVAPASTTECGDGCGEGFSLVRLRIMQVAVLDELRRRVDVERIRLATK
jgi:hypothetical protein